MEHKGTAPLQTRRLILRPFTLEDTDSAFRNWMGDAAVTAFLRWQPHTDAAVTRSVIEHWVGQYADAAFYQWAIVPKELGQPIGSISVVDRDERTAKLHIGYCIGRSWWNQGYTSEAFSRVLRFLFCQVKAGRVESQHDPCNAGSGRVMQKCGLRFEGTLRRADWSNRGIVDACMYSLLAEEYFAGTHAPQEP